LRQGLQLCWSLAISSWTTTGAVFLAKLEDRFQRPGAPLRRTWTASLCWAAHLKRVSRTRGGYELNEAGDRMVEAAGLALAYPGARIIVSGGNPTFSTICRRCDDSRHVFLSAWASIRRGSYLKGNRETRSKMSPKANAWRKPGEGLASGHVSLPHAAFCRTVSQGWMAGCSLANGLSYGRDGRVWLCGDDAGRCLRQASVALREWIGLGAYWAMGRIDEPFPAP
jgi:hypothetical protein